MSYISAWNWYLIAVFFFGITLILLAMRTYIFVVVSTTLTVAAGYLAFKKKFKLEEEPEKDIPSYY